MNTEKVVVIITSVIYFVGKRLSYSKTRSIFSPQKRLDQTKKTIRSIREKIPGAKIILCEQGTKDVSIELNNIVDSYKYIGNDKFVRFATDSLFKGYGEAVSLLSLSKLIPKDTERIFKMSGRYYLNDKFDLNKWNDGEFIIKKYKNSMSTRFYSFTKNMINTWKKSLIFSIPFLFVNRSIENTMLMFIPKNKIKEIDTVGVSGSIGVNDELINE